MKELYTKYSQVSMKNRNEKRKSVSLFVSVLLFLFTHIGLSAQEHTTLGTDFWVSFGRIADFGFDERDYPMSNYVPQIRVAATRATTVTITFTETGVSEQVILSAGESFTRSLDAEKEQVYSKKTGTSSKSVHIESPYPISVYALNQADATTDASNILPVVSLGVNYYQMSYTSYSYPEGGVNYVDGYTIVATENGTQVKDVTRNVVVSLNKGQVYSFYSAAGVDLTGQHIVATKPIAYFVTNAGTMVPKETHAADCLYQQMMPVNAWGTSFLIPTSVRGKERIRVLASLPNTRINVQGTYQVITGNLSARLGEGQFVELEITDGCYLTADKAVAVTSYFIGGSANPNPTHPSNNGDPSATWIPPLEQTVNEISISSFVPKAASRLKDHYALVVTATANKKDTQIAVGNGAFTALPSHVTWTDNTASGFSYCNLFLHTTRNDSGIGGESETYHFSNPNGVIIYGYGLGDPGEAYFYLAGAATRSINPSFYVNGIHHDDVRGAVFCDPRIHVKAAIYSKSATDFAVNWWIDGNYALDLGTTTEEWTRTLTPGKHTIRMEVKNYQEEIDVRETEFVINSVSISNPGSNDLAVGQTRQLTGTGYPALLTGTWESSSPLKVSVDPNGLVTALDVTTEPVYITYTHNGCSKSIALTVGMGQCPFFTRTYVKDYTKATPPADGVKDGSSWEHAYDGLHDVLKAAADYPGCIEEIWVAAGTYYPYPTGQSSAGRNDAFVLVPGVKIYGGFPTNAKDDKDAVDLTGSVRIDTRLPFEASTDRSVLSGDLNKNGNWDNADAYHVVIAADNIPYYATETAQNRNTVLDGFVVRGGVANAATSSVVNGVLLWHNVGGGMLIHAASPLLNRILFEQNYALNDGGAMAVEQVCTPYIANSIFRNNQALVNGGGLSLATGAEVSLLNVLMYANQALRGGGIYAKEYTTVHLMNATLSGNTGTLSGAGVEVSTAYIYNSIIWGNNGTDATGVLPFRLFSLIAGYPADDSAGNIEGSTDPLFVNAAAGNYRLSPLSPVIDKGHVALFNNLDRVFGSEGRDLASVNRVQDASIDLGPYECHKTVNMWIGAGGTGSKNISPDPVRKNWWSVAENWTAQIIPGEEEVVLYHEDAIDLWVNEDYKVKGVDNRGTGKNLVVLKNKKLEITSSTDYSMTAGGKLIVKSGAPDDYDPTVGKNAAFISPAGMSIPADVEFYSKAQSPAGEMNPDKMNWQYFGVPVLSTNSPTYIYAHTFLSGTAVRKYVEGTNAYWQLVQPNTLMEPYKGYEISWWNGDGRKGVFTYQGYLLNTDKTFTLDKGVSSSLLFPGQHVMSNPYTAGLKIDGGLVFGSGMDKTVYLFHTGSSLQWDNWVSGLTGDGAGAGQYIAVPQMQAGAGLYLPETISSMQGFVVKVLETSDNTLRFRYDGGVKENTALLRSASAEKEEKVFSVISLSHAEVLKDRMWIFADPRSTRTFDNGYDGKKILASHALAQLYAVEEDGNYQVNTVPDIHNTYLAFKAEEGTKEYTLTFNHKGMENSYGNLYLIDLIADKNKKVDITAEGATYSFTAEYTAAAVKRFRLVTEANTTTDIEEINVCTFDIHQVENDIYLSNGDQKATVSLYNLTGVKLYQTNLQPHQSSRVLKSFLPGVYIVYVQLPDTILTKKIIVR